LGLDFRMIEQSRILSEDNLTEYNFCINDTRNGYSTGEGYGCGEVLGSGDEDGAGYGCGEVLGSGDEIGGQRISSPDSSCGAGFG